MAESSFRSRWSLSGVASAALLVGLLGGFGLCGLTLAAFVGRTHWLLEITTHFRTQYAVLLIAYAAVYVLARHRRMGALFAAFALINVAVLAPRFWPQPDAPMTTPRLKILVANVLSSNTQYDALERLIAKENPDVIALVEVNEAWLRGLSGLAQKYGHTFRVPREDNFGVALFSRRGFADIETVFFASPEIPSIRATLVLSGQRRVQVLVTHPVPPGSPDGVALRDQQLTAIARWSAAATTPVIVVGDLNCAPWSPAFRSLLAEGKLKDSGYGYSPTWPVSPWWLRIPLDHCLVGPTLHIADHRVGPDIGSDHFPFIVTVALPRATRP